MSSALKFLVGGYGKTITLFSFDAASKSLNVVKSNSGFVAPTWVEASASSTHKGKVFYGVSEENGQVKSLELKDDGSLEETGSVPTNGNPAHIHALKDGSGVVATNYMGGSAVFIPIDRSTGAVAAAPSTAQSLLSNVTNKVGSVSPVFEFQPHSPYGKSSGPRKDRQEASHPHQCIEGQNGDLYVCDLGSDRIWQLQRKGENALELVGQADAVAGVGPRHATLHSNGKYLYLITELAHQAFIYPVPFGKVPATPVHTEGTLTAPKDVPTELYPEMTSGEIVLHPTSERVLYISNRGQVDLNSKTGKNVKGDAIAVITLNENGDEFTNVEIVPTELNFIRGMQISKDGKYLAAVGQKDGKVAVYQTGGQYGEKLELVASVEAGLDMPTDVTWV